MPKVFSTEPFMHDGNVVMPGESVDVSPDDAASILHAGRGTLDAADAKTAAKQYAAAQAAISAAA